MSISEQTPHTARFITPARLGEELPIFCEKCGYSLHGLPAGRCETCSILHHRCPECGHTQPINTLRPAFQRILGRARAWGLAAVIFVKLNYFIWLLVAWFAMGVEWSYSYNYRPNNPTFSPRPLDWESLFGFTLFGLAFGLVSRMLLLRWRKGYVVGLILGVLACAAIYIGASANRRFGLPNAPDFLTNDFMLLMGAAFLMIVLGAGIVWPIWVAIVHLFLPRRTGSALLDWQREQSNRPADLARE